MQAAILAIGDELTSGVTADTNSHWLAGRLRERGIAVREMRSVPDERDLIAQAIRDLSRDADLLVVSGGLGPTPDDLTRRALGAVLTPGEDLVLDEGALRKIQSWFSRSGRVMPESNRLQAMHPHGSLFIENQRGTAPGIEARSGKCRIIVMPGVPAEMKAMFERVADESLPAIGQRIRAVHTYGIGESDLATRLGSMLDRDRRPRLGTAAGGGDVSVRLYPEGESEEEIRQVLEQIEQRLLPYAYGKNDDTLASALGGLLRAGNKSLATAESCTGGLLGAMATDVAGSSEWYRGGWVTYSNEMKQCELHVPPELISGHGAVSAEVARAMAEGAMRGAASGLGLAITGIAGPSGGTDAKPVGTVFIACAESKRATIVRHFRLRGDRSEIRDRAARSALQLARFQLLDVGGDAILLGEAPKESRSL